MQGKRTQGSTDVTKSPENALKYQKQCQNQTSEMNIKEEVMDGNAIGTDNVSAMTGHVMRKENGK